MNSSKSKTDIIFYTCLILCLLIFGILFLSSCSKDVPGKKEANPCGTLATVKDFKELSTCGYLLVLDNGDILRPVIFCGTPPLSRTDDFVLHKLRDGMRVSIGYEGAPHISSICMNGKNVFITCIEEVDTGAKD